MLLGCRRRWPRRSSVRWRSCATSWGRSRPWPRRWWRAVSCGAGMATSRRPSIWPRPTGTTAGEAAEVIKTGRTLTGLPVLDAAARAGEVSPQQAAAVANAATADPSAEERLVETAKTTSLPELRDECARTRAAADPDPEARRTADPCRAQPQARGPISRVCSTCATATTPRSAPRSWPSCNPPSTACSATPGRGPTRTPRGLRRRRPL